jgi:large subunit ribosomal protein L16
MLQPRKRKYTKEFRGSMRRLSQRGSDLSYGEMGIQAIEKGWIDSKQIESARKAIVNSTARKGKLWIKIFPHKPITKKSDEVVRGGGKGPVDHYVAVIKPGRVLFEIGGLTDDISKAALELGRKKLPIKTRLVIKHTLK